MSFIPDDALKGKEGINFAPMIDFLFLMLMFFACMAVSRAAYKDTEIHLVEVKPEDSTNMQSKTETKFINISITAEGEYKLMTEGEQSGNYLPSAEDVAKYLIIEYENGALPANKEQTQILLKIDKDATWEPILTAIFAVRDAGFSVRPVYEPKSK